VTKKIEAVHRFGGVNKTIKTKIMKLKYAYLLTALILASCTSQRLVTGVRVKKEPKVYWQGVAVLAVSTIVLMNWKFKTE
jgi:hypothetical protein